MAKKIKNYTEYAEITDKAAQLFNNQNYEEAQVLFEDLADYNSGNYKIFETLVTIYLKLNNIEAAEEAYRKTRELFAAKSGVQVDLKTFDQVVSEMDSLEILEKKYKEQQQKSGTSESDTFPEVHRISIMMGMQYMARGEFKKAEEHLLAHKNRYFTSADT